MYNIDKKEKELEKIIKKYNKIAIAYSGGVDSLYLLNKSIELLGVLNVVAFTLKTPLIPEREFIIAKNQAELRKVKHRIIVKEDIEFEWFKDNPKDRCYICKKSGFGSIKKEAELEGIEVLFDGTNIDDLGDYRPGLQAAYEIGVISPLKDAGLKKSDIRELSKKSGIEGWDRASFTCLATRFLTGEKIDIEKVKMVEVCEDFLVNEGFREFRVRVHQDIARIEIAKDEIETFLEKNNREKCEKKFKDVGFKFVSVELGGYVRGNMN